ncbi:hypothetical protein KO566_02845 [Flavobacteriaceae bacterium XHP0103]|uniref:BfmA/BtgA family mobilization protein n=1 Tax=Marixanthotalea marina TaxID=2844359 RepID=UPI00298A06F9|nr:BfmA/BtgA family mobilization protein [Marixanthotalea marina]MBU3820985.1 hypothetical protein [Marixanthotalea marina]
MDKGYEHEGFETIKIKTSVVQQFRAYCKTISKSQSMALHHMVSFFEMNGISPEDNLGDTIANLKGFISKRSNAQIAIIKNIEKKHHNPTTAILQSLFEETAHLENEQKAQESLDFGTPALISENEELSYYKEAYFKSQEAHGRLKREMTDLLKKVKHVKNNFGIRHYRLNVTNEELETLKQKLE